MGTQEPEPVSPLFWKGVRNALPLALIGWILIAFGILGGINLWHHFFPS